MKCVIFSSTFLKTDRKKLKFNLTLAVTLKILLNQEKSGSISSQEQLLKILSTAAGTFLITECSQSRIIMPNMQFCSICPPIILCKLKFRSINYCNGIWMMDAYFVLNYLHSIESIDNIVCRMFTIHYYYYHYYSKSYVDYSTHICLQMQWHHHELVV